MMLGTLMLPYHVTLIPQYVLFLNLGWVDTFLPLVVPKFLAVDAFFIFLMVQFFRGIPRELDEAAMMDGCSPWRIYWKIMLPLSHAGAGDRGDLHLHLDLGRFLRAADLPQRHAATTPCSSACAPSSTRPASRDWGGLFAMSMLSLRADLRLLPLLPAPADRGHRHHRHEALSPAMKRHRMSALRFAAIGLNHNHIYGQVELPARAPAPSSSPSTPTRTISPPPSPRSSRRRSASPTGARSSRIGSIAVVAHGGHPGRARARSPSRRCGTART